MARCKVERIIEAGSAKELLDTTRVISIFDKDSYYPFPLEFVDHPNLLALRFNDVDPELLDLEDNGEFAFFRFEQGVQAVKFVKDNGVPLLVHCKGRARKSGALAVSFDRRYNAPNSEDHIDFTKHNTHLIPNNWVMEVMKCAFEKKRNVRRK